MDFKIYSKRLFLRPPCNEDLTDLFHLMSDNSLTEFLTWEPHNNVETTKDVVQALIGAQQKDLAYHWCVLHKNRIIGFVSLIDVKRKMRTWIMNRAELSFWIGTPFQGQGFASEASMAVCDFGFGKLSLHRIIVAHALENSESESICKKLKFSKFAHEHDAFQKDGTWHDLIWYELISNNEVD